MPPMSAVGISGLQDGEDVKIKTELDIFEKKKGAVKPLIIQFNNPDSKLMNPHSFVFATGSNNKELIHV